MNENGAILSSTVKDKVDDAVQFIPSISSLATGELELWLNALQSGKDVQFNLTTSESGLLQITFVDPHEERQQIDSNNGGNNENQKETSAQETTSPSQITAEDPKCDANKSVEWGLFRNSKGNIVAHPLNDFVDNAEEKLATLESSSLPIFEPVVLTQPNSGSSSENKTSKKSLATEQKNIQKQDKEDTSITEKDHEVCNSESPTHVDNISNSPIIVTVAIEDSSNADCNFYDKRPVSPVDPDIFPCVRPEWYNRPPKSPNKALIDDQCVINTIVLADDMRRYLKHNSIVLTNFSQNYLQRSQGTLSDVLNHPKPWNGLSSRGKSIYLKMMQFLSAENLHDVVADLKQAYLSVRPGPLPSVLPPSIMESLRKNVMPSAALVEDVAATYDLKTFQLRSYCEAQLRKEQESMDVIVELVEPKLDVNHNTITVIELVNKKKTTNVSRGKNAQLLTKFVSENEPTDMEPSSDSVSQTQGSRTASSSYVKPSTKDNKPRTFRSGFQPRHNERHICPVSRCGYILGSKLSLEHHLTTHSGERPFKCDVCARRFATVSNLRCHRRRHLNRKVSKRALKAAMLRKAHESDRTVMEIAERRPHPDSDLHCNIALRSSKINLECPPSTCVYTCGVCFRRLPSKQSLQYHMTTYHHITANMKGGDKLFTCHVCSKAFKTKASLFVHLRRHNGDRPFHCKFCKKRFYSKTNCLRHSRTHTGAKPYRCPKCQARFTEAGSVAAHMRIHTGEKPYACETCGKRFSQSGSLKSHRLLHTGCRPYLCATCGLAFRQKANLRAHELRHQGIRQFVCHVCSHASKSKSELQQHLLKHTNERPYRCNACPMGFTRLQYLKEHVHKVHDLAPYQCERCGLGFPTKSALVLHQTMESESRLNTQAVKVDKSDTQENVNETIVSGAEYASSILQVLTDTICCLSPLSPGGDGTSHVPSVMANNSDPSLPTSNQNPPFALNSNGNVPVAIVMDRGLVFASTENLDPNMIESGQVVSSDMSLGVLSKVPLAGSEVCSTVVADSSDPNMQSVIVAAEDCDQLESGARYVVVSVSDDAATLANSSSFPMTSVTLERTSSE